LKNPMYHPKVKALLSPQKTAENQQKTPVKPEEKKNYRA